MVERCPYNFTLVFQVIQTSQYTGVPDGTVVWAFPNFIHNMQVVTTAILNCKTNYVNGFASSILHKHFILFISFFHNASKLKNFNTPVLFRYFVFL